MKQRDWEKKKLIVRADGNARIGVGHLMRCLTIVSALSASEREGVLFLCAEEGSAEMVVEHGFDAKVLHSDYRNLLPELDAWERLFGEGMEAAGAETGWAKDTEGRTILVDSYSAAAEYLQALRSYGRVVLLDDTGNPPRPADVVINYNVFADEKLYASWQGEFPTRFYTGSAYIPIREAFCRVDYTCRDRVENILITTGGGDVDNIAGQILDKIRQEKCCYHVVTGRYNPHYEELQRLSEESGQLYIYHDVKDMAALMSKCDLAITAGGTTVYELCAIGVPFVCFSYAENQEPLTEYIGAGRIAGYGGAFHKKPEETLTAIRIEVERLRKDYKLRLAYAKAEKELVDGKGAARISEILWRD